MTSRLAPGGLQSLVGLKPDLTSFGKYLGGGITFGAFGGRLDIMAVYDPRVANSLAHSGTFNNNTLGMSAGYVGLSQIYTPEVAVAFNKVGDDLRGKLQDAAVGTKMTVTGKLYVLKSWKITSLTFFFFFSLRSRLGVGHPLPQGRTQRASECEGASGRCAVEGAILVRDAGRRLLDHPTRLNCPGDGYTSVGARPVC